MTPPDHDPDARPATLALPPSAALALKMLLAALIVAALWFGEEILVPFALAGLLSFIRWRGGCPASGCRASPRSCWW